MHYLSYKEGKQHGTPEFPVAYYYIDREHPSYNMPFHWHKEWELIRIIKGSFSLSIDADIFDAKEGDTFLLRDGALHGGIPYDCIYECLSFDLRELYKNIPSVKEYISPFYKNIYLPSVCYPSFHTDVYHIIDELMKGFSAETPEGCCQLTTLGNLSLLFAVILKKEYFTSDTASLTDITKKIMQIKPVFEHIENNYASPITLKELAKLAGMNPNYFCRFFASITNQTPINYIIYYRMEQACNMLCNTNMTVMQVAFECGFNDTTHFVKSFKKHKGVTPKQYQIRNQ